MYPPNSYLPTQSTNDNRPFKRHHTARYYAHRVRESLATRICKLICTIFLFVLFTVGLIAFILWLSLRPHRPRLHLEDLQVPALTQPNGFQNAQVTFNITIRNSNRKIAVQYYSIQASVFYKDQNIGTIPLVTGPFEQQPKTTMVLPGSLSGATLTVNSQRWNDLMTERAAGKVSFRVQITSVIKFEVVVWGSKHHKMHANCDAQVGSDGSLLPISKGKRCPEYFT